MRRELLERLGIVAASALATLALSCALASPPTGAAVDQDLRTDATQITAQAAPGSVVQIGTPTTTEPAPIPP